MRCINVPAQPQELRFGSLLGTDQISDGNSVGVQEGPNVGKCPEHVTTLLAQALEICNTPGKERQV